MACCFDDMVNQPTTNQAQKQLFQALIVFLVRGGCVTRCNEVKTAFFYLCSTGRSKHTSSGIRSKRIHDQHHRRGGGLGPASNSIHKNDGQHQKYDQEQQEQEQKRISSTSIIKTRRNHFFSSSEQSPPSSTFSPTVQTTPNAL